MTRPTDAASAPAPSVSSNFHRVLVLLGIAALAVITLVSPGATRMYSWPWSLAYAVALSIPACVLLLRLGDARRPLRLPGTAWCLAVLAAGGGVLASGLLSPFRGPSLQGGVSLLAALALFLVVVDWLHAAPDQTSARRKRLLAGTGWFLTVVALSSMGLWAIQLHTMPVANQVFASRNPFPLGHSNYTAGLALFMLPCFGALLWLERGKRRIVWAGAAMLALAMMLTSGSRGGFVGLVVLAVAFAPLLARALRLKLWLIATVGLAIVLGLLAWNPRTRAMLRREPASAEPNLSNVQRTAMLTAGWRMGADRPLLGWGPGSTPFVYPHYRAGLEGGAENVLQLHSAPIQLWAELGVFGLVGAFAFLLLALRAAVVTQNAIGPDLRSGSASQAADLECNHGDTAFRPHLVVLGLAGYGVFSFTDWQLDVPVFAFALAAGAALLPAPAAGPRFSLRVALGVLSFAALASIALLGRRDPTSALNVQALALAQNSAKADAAIGLLQKSLALNPDQEIAHFNLGWLLVVRDPAVAERHFLAAAHLVPDKGGVYFGLGLARLNQGRREAAVRAFALECLNDPLFLTSPWWRVPPLGELRQTHALEFIRLSQEVAQRLALRGGWVAREAAYNAALTEWLLGQSAPGEMLGRSLTPERVTYFAHRPAPPDFKRGPVRAYRRERTGYPVLMRDLDLPVPTDLFDVQENPLAADELRFLFSRKGWLPSPLLLALLDGRVSAKP